MTGSQLTALRRACGWSQRDVAAKLLDVTDATVCRWEASEKEIPQWASQKLLGEVSITLSLSDMHALLDLARATNTSFEIILSEAIRHYIAKHKPSTSLLAGTTLAEDKA